jgi:hypothetical protein
MSPIINRVPDFEEGQTFIIENVFVDFASVFKPNTKYRPEWAVVIRVPQAMIQNFYEVGFRLKQDPEGQVTLRAKRYVRLDNGEEMQPPTVEDCDNSPWTEARGLIGNGSRCNVKVRAKYTTYQGIEGLSCFLEGLQILDHVPYYGSGPQFGVAQGTTGGFDQGFQQPPPPPPQQPAQGYGMPAREPAHDPNPYNPAPPAAIGQPQQAFIPPGQQQPQAPPPPQQQAFVPPGQQQPQAAGVAPAYNPAVPTHMQPQAQGTNYAQPPTGVQLPQGPPQDGNVSVPPQAIGGYPLPQEPQPFQQQPQPAAVGQPTYEAYDPTGPSTGDDVPF